MDGAFRPAVTHQAQVDASNPLAETLARVSHEKSCGVLVLPDKARLLVFSEGGLDVLRALLNDPDFYVALEEGLSDLRADRVTEFAEGDRPSLLDHPEIREALAEGLEDLAAGRVTFLEPSQRPAPPVKK